MDLNFEQMLATHNQNFKDAEVYSNWMPDDGEYIVSLVKLDYGTSSKDGTDLVWWNLKGRIEDVQDEKLNGKEFTVGYYTSKVFGILKGAVNILSGQQISDITEAHAILEAAVGLVIRVKVDTSFSTKHQKDFTNCYILEVINTTTEASTEPTGDYGVDAPPVEAPADVPTEVPTA